MRRASLAMAVMVAAILAGAVAALVACNAVLGIERATLADGGAAVVTDDGAGGTTLTCPNYCDIMMQNCTGKNQEYLSRDVCLALCKYMLVGVSYPAGMTPDNVDTLGCRLWHANVAATAPDAHCRHAGPLGADLCGGPCAPFCSLDWRYCTDDKGIQVYSGQVPGCEGVCMSDAGAFPYVRGDSGDLVDPSGTMIEMGNTLNCRLWHLETAIDKNLPDPHCLHTGEQSATCK
jgi:hypothetical protein